MRVSVLMVIVVLVPLLAYNRFVNRIESDPGSSSTAALVIRAPLESVSPALVPPAAHLPGSN